MILKLLFFILQLSSVHGHGYLLYPPSRSSLFRVKSRLPADVTEKTKNDIVPNYTDNELNCGGLSHQISLGYKCGICGDPYDGVRKNEAGGIYAKNQIISAKYKEADTISIEVVITAHHKGFFQFKLCENQDISKRVSQNCLDKHTLLVEQNGLQTDKFDITSGTVGDYLIKAKLPKGVSCKACVLQWRYHAGNNWGVDPVTGRSGLGFGHQEEFFGCADISISKNIGGLTTVGITENLTMRLSSKLPAKSSSSRMTESLTTKTSNSATQSPSSAICKARGLYKSSPLIVSFCRDGCKSFGNRCPATHCECPNDKFKIVCKSLLASITKEWCETTCFALVSASTDCQTLKGYCNCQKV